MREALDPSNERKLALPPDRELLAELCAPRWVPQTNGVKVEGKEDIKKRLGRSIDKADAVVLAAAARAPAKLPGPIPMTFTDGGSGGLRPSDWRRQFYGPREPNVVRRGARWAPGEIVEDEG